MTQDFKALTPFGDTASIKDIHESLGVAALSIGGDPDFWHQTVGGLLMQGGTFSITSDTNINVNYVVPYANGDCPLWMGFTVISNSGIATMISWPAVDPNGVFFNVSCNTEGALVETVQVRWFAIGV